MSGITGPNLEPARSLTGAIPCSAAQTLSVPPLSHSLRILCLAPRRKGKLPRSQIYMATVPGVTASAARTASHLNVLFSFQVDCLLQTMKTAVLSISQFFWAVGITKEIVFTPGVTIHSHTSRNKIFHVRYIWESKEGGM